MKVLRAMVRDIQHAGVLDYKNIVAKISEKYIAPFFTSTIKICAIFLSIVQQSLVGQGLLIIEASRSNSGTPHSVGPLWTRDQPEV